MRKCQQRSTWKLMINFNSCQNTSVARPTVLTPSRKKIWPKPKGFTIKYTIFVIYTNTLSAHLDDTYLSALVRLHEWIKYLRTQTAHLEGKKKPTDHTMGRTPFTICVAIEGMLHLRRRRQRRSCKTKPGNRESSKQYTNRKTTDFVCKKTTAVPYGNRRRGKGGAATCEADDEERPVCSSLFQPSPRRMEGRTMGMRTKSWEWRWRGGGGVTRRGVEGRKPWGDDTRERWPLFYCEAGERHWVRTALQFPLFLLVSRSCCLLSCCSDWLSNGSDPVKVGASVATIIL